MVGEAQAGAARRMMGRRALLAAGFAVASSPAFGQRGGGGAESAALNGQHPAAYYKRAGELFGSGRRDDAVFVFYLGQLRFRTHLRARPNLKPDGDPALFASLSEVVGRPINEYAFGDLEQLDETLLAVMAWDRANPDRFTPAAEFPEAHRQQREGMQAFRKQILMQADSIRRQRAANGLENRR